MYMLDTDICIYTIKQKPRKVLERLTATVARNVCMSAITYAELMNGALKSREVEGNLKKLHRLSEVLDVVPFDATAAESYGRVRCSLEQRGQPIGSLDMLIADHALAIEAILVTNNEREFRRVDGLNIENRAV